MTPIRAGFALCLALLIATPAAPQEAPPSAQGEAAPATEPAALPAPAVDPGAPEGAETTAAIRRGFDRYALPVRPFTSEAPGTREVQGEVAMAAYRLDDPGASVAGIMAGYRGRLAAQGFEPVLDCANEGCGGFDFRFGATLLPAPAMLMDAADFAQLTMRRGGSQADGPDIPSGAGGPAPGGGSDGGRADGDEADGSRANGGPMPGGGGPAVWVSVLASRVLGVVHVQTVTVRESAEPPRITEAPERTGDEILVLPQSLDDLRERLLSEGHVRVQGLLFEEGGATLSSDSTAALDMLAELLKQDASLSVAIVGHSDNAGALGANIEISRRRAEAVERALVERGVSDDRLESHGAGWLAPVTANDSDAGRALNRRVELVLR